MRTIELYNKIENVNARSAWDKGVKWYALYLMENLQECTDVVLERAEIESVLLNGARDWKQYSYGGCALIYGREIAETLCSPSELKSVTRKDGTIRQKANSHETWLDVQARALYQACKLIKRAYNELNK